MRGVTRRIAWSVTPLTMVAAVGMAAAATAMPTWASTAVSPSCSLGTCAVTFATVGTGQAFTVPAGVSSLSVTLYGARGGSTLGSILPGGDGAEVTATLEVSPDTTLGLDVGGAGQDATRGTSAGGVNGGGNGDFSGAGGGATDLTSAGTRLLVAGGGGGAGGEGASVGTQCSGAGAGPSGGAAGNADTAGSPGTADIGGGLSLGGGGGGRPGVLGGAGSKTTGAGAGGPGGGGFAGRPGASNSCGSPAPGIAGNGGSGSAGGSDLTGTFPGGGGGGGGYFGGGAGGEGATDGNGNLAGSGGGGGGASFMAGSGISSGGVIDTGNAGNINSGNGEAVFSWTDPISGGTPSYTTTEAEALSVPASAGLLSSTEGTSAPAGDPLTASGPVGGATAQGGTVTVHADGSFTYTPPSAFSGADSFTFTISDPSGDSATGTATIGVKAATPAQLTAALLQAVQRVGPGHSLAGKVTRAQAYLASGDIAGTCSVFGSFTNEVEAQTGKHIPRATAGQVITLTQEIQTVLGC